LKSVLLAIIAVLVSTVALAAGGPSIDMSSSAIERGQNVFVSNCNACHGLKYYRDRDHMSGYAPLMDAATAEMSFGAAPPDLSLITSARGKSTHGAEYVYEFLTSYYTDADGRVKNRAFAEETQTEGVTAMPQPFSADDPELEEKAHDVAAFLYTVSDPSEPERHSLGKYVLVYMVIMTALLYALNKLTWKKVNKKLER
jgi:ubiquinol-cytochrome c reductase cytochrome c1 subunit